MEPKKLKIGQTEETEHKWSSISHKQIFLKLKYHETSSMK